MPQETLSDLTLRLGNEISELRGLINTQTTEVSRLSQTVARIDERTLGLQVDIQEIRREMVTKPRFRPVETLAYGLAGIFLSSIAYALVSYVIKTTN